MRSFLRRRSVLIPVFAGLIALCAAGIWRYGYVQALGQIRSQGEADLRLASDRLTRNLQRFQELVVLLADHPTLEKARRGGSAEDAQRLLLAAADKTSARNLIYLTPDGKVLASAHPVASKDLHKTPYVKRALQGALGAFHDVTETDRDRRYYYAAPGFAANGRVHAVLAVVIDVEATEFEWRGDRPAVYFTDDQGMVFVTNRTEMLLWRQTGSDPGQMLDAQGRKKALTRTRVGPHRILKIDWGPYLPKRAILLSLPLPVIELTGYALVDVAPALRLAGLQAAVFAALSLAAGALLFLISDRRRVLAEQNLRLEARVQERTQELRRAQADVIQAGKLSALGQMSAGISHELNQPLMAIRSFAENAEQFLERGQPEVAAQNLSRISDLAHRMGRIIKNLRAFARNESEAISDVDLAHIVEGALDLSRARLQADGVTLNWTAPAGPIWVRGGEVRLGQVVLNLISNACDAMQEVQGKDLTLAITLNSARVTLSVADNGPGISEPDKVFDPFYSTKSIGAAEGMGLGLSISYGLVQSFGGAIKGSNLPEGGAMFTIELERAKRESEV